MSQILGTFIKCQLKLKFAEHEHKISYLLQLRPFTSRARLEFFRAEPSRAGSWLGSFSKISARAEKSSRKSSLVNFLCSKSISRLEFRLDKDIFEPARLGSISKNFGSARLVFQKSGS